MMKYIRIDVKDIIKLLSSSKDVKDIVITYTAPIKHKLLKDVIEYTSVSVMINYDYDEYLKLIGKYDITKDRSYNRVGDWIGGPVIRGRGDRIDNYYLCFFYKKGAYKVQNMYCPNLQITDSIMSDYELNYSLDSDQYMVYRNVNFSNIHEVVIDDIVYTPYLSKRERDYLEQLWVDV